MPRRKPYACAKRHYFRHSKRTKLSPHGHWKVVRWLETLGWRTVAIEMPTHRELYSSKLPKSKQPPGFTIMQMAAPDGSTIEIRVPGARQPLERLSVVEWRELMVSTLMPMWWRVFNKPLPVMPSAVARKG